MIDFRGRFLNSPTSQVHENMPHSSMPPVQFLRSGATTFRVAIWLSGLFALAVVQSCMPLPPEGGGIDVGTTSDQWTVRFDPALGTPASMVNRALRNETGSTGAKPVDSAVAEAAVQQVFHSRTQWFRLRSGVDAFRLVRDETRGWLRYQRFEQTYRGLSVAGAGYEAHVLPNGRVGSLEGSYFPDLNVDIRPTFGESQARDRARNLFQLGAPSEPLPQLQYEIENGFREASVLTIVPQGGNFLLAWGIVVAVGSRDHARVYIDARTGSALGRQMIGWSDTR